MAKVEKTEKEQAPAQEAPAKSGGGGLKLILIIVGAVVISMGVAGGGVWWYLSHHTASAEKGKKAAEEKPTAKAIYYDMKPAFVVTMTESETGNLRYMQVQASVVTRDGDVPEVLKLHDPEIRNNLNMLFSSYQPSQLATAGGREQLAKRALDEINRVVEKETKKKNACEAVLFTSFVIQ